MDETTEQFLNRTTRHEPMSCPVCTAPNDAATPAPDRSTSSPGDGDYALCFTCGGVGVYAGTPPTEIRNPTDEELAEIVRNPEVRFMQKMVKEAIAAGKGGSR